MTRSWSAWLHPLFVTGFLVRLLLIWTVEPQPVLQWYAPFLARTTDALTFDPWGVWLEAGGTSAAFPYGSAMWLVLDPLTVVFKIADWPIKFAYALTLLIFDLALLWVMTRWTTGRWRLMLLIYWCSPIVIIASYALGYNDLIPVFFLSLALWYLKESHFGRSGAALACAVSAKLSMGLAVPFFAIYLLGLKRYPHGSARFAGAFVLGCVVLGWPLAFSGAALHMIASNPEILKIYSFAIDFGHQFSIYAVPLAYFWVLYFFWRIKRLNFDLLQAMMGIGFLAVILLTPAGLGWFFWCIPFLCLYQAMSGRVAVGVVTAFSAVYALVALQPLLLEVLSTAIGRVGAVDPLGYERGSSLLRTGLLAMGVILVARIWREAVIQNLYFRATRRPFVIGIAGDSGAGKDTFVDGFARVLGEASVTKLSGDNYHLWDRKRPIWKVMTHLNPLANDLEAFAKDLSTLSQGGAIQLKHYDHATGLMLAPVKTPSNDFILASGLHALYFPAMRDCCDLKIYLDIDEGLRRHFKIQRDMHQRGHPLERVLDALRKREPDAARFIRPQAAYADLIFSLQCSDGPPADLEVGRSMHMRLGVKTRQGYNERSLSRVLVGVCGLHVEKLPDQDIGLSHMVIDGDVSADDMALAAQLLCPGMSDFLAPEPQWAPGVLGLMQLITLAHLHQMLTTRYAA